MINLFELFNFLSQVLNKPINVPSLVYYNIANILEKKIKKKTIDFIYSKGLSVDDELTINEFSSKIASRLNLDEFTCIVIFKGLDISHKGKIKIEDFVLVVDSYRDDMIEEYRGFMKKTHQMDKHKAEFLTKELLEKFKEIVEANYLTISDFYEKLPSEEKE